MSTNNYIGRTLGNYRIVAQVGGGAFGNVYRAEHIHLQNRTVAIKIMHMAHLDSDEDRERFIKEARLLEKLAHPHILPILDVGHSEGFPYLITTYAANGSLRDRLRRMYPQQLPINETLRILSQVGEAISFAHQQNVIHRDVKPANILFDEKGNTLLADFGIATTLASASIKNINEMTGSAPYMAPEQFQGKISKECDQYALGCIAYELFTGQQPFNAPDFVSMAFKHMTEMPPSPHQFNPNIPPHAANAILKAIAKNRTDRYPSVQAFIQALLDDPNATMKAPPGFVPVPLPSPGPTGPISNASPYETVLDTGLDKTERASTREYTPFPESPPVTPIPVAPITPLPPTYVPPLEPMVLNDTGSIASPPPGTYSGDGRTMVAPLATKPVPLQPPPKKRRRLWLIAAILVLLLLLIPGSVAAFYTFAYPATATVTIGLSYKDVKQAFTITAMASNPDSTKNQVSGVFKLTSTKTQNKQGSASGSVSTDAANAGGVLNFINNTNCSGLYVVAGSSWGPDNNGISIIVPQQTTLPIGQVVAASAYATPAGAAGNIPANDISGTDTVSGCTGTVSYSNSAFGGGVDAGTQTVVQQSDIDSIAKPMTTTLTQAATKDLQSKVQAGQHLIGTPQCSHSAKSDQTSGATASSFNVTVTVTCTQLALNPQAAQAMAQSMLKSYAQSSPGPHYTLANTISTTLGTAHVVDINKGIVTQDITAEGMWAYAFTQADKQRLASFIEGKTAQDAKNLLLNQNGVRTVNIDLYGTFLFWNKLPTNINNISFVSSDTGIPNLGATPTRTLGTPTSGKTPTPSH